MERPVAALAQHDVEQAITIEVADVHAGRSFAFILQQENAFKGAEGLFRSRRRLAQRGGQKEEGDDASGRPKSALSAALALEQRGLAPTEGEKTQ